MDERMKDEYVDLSANMRHYANMRFAQLSIFVALTAALVNAIFEKGGRFSFGANTAVKIGGLIIVLVFWAMEESAADYWNHFRKRAIVLEDTLGYQQYKDRPTHRLRGFTATNAVRFLFLVVSAFWVIMLLHPSMFSVMH